MIHVRVAKSELLAAVVGATLLFACEQKSGPANVTKVAAVPRKPDAVAPAPATEVPAKAPLPPDPSAPVEVEMEGKVELPDRADLKSRKVLLYVARNDCLDPKAKVYAVTPVSDSRNFFSEIFPPQGTDLSLCAAVDEGEGKPATIYGALPRTLHAVGVGEVVFSRLVIKLKPQRPHLFQKK